MEYTFVGIKEVKVSRQVLLNMVALEHQEILEMTLDKLERLGWDGRLSDLKYKYNLLRLTLLDYREDWEACVDWLEENAAEITNFSYSQSDE